MQHGCLKVNGKWAMVILNPSYLHPLSHIFLLLSGMTCLGTEPEKLGWYHSSRLHRYFWELQGSHPELNWPLHKNPQVPPLSHKSSLSRKSELLATQGITGPGILNAKVSYSLTIRKAETSSFKKHGSIRIKAITETFSVHSNLYTPTFLKIQGTSRLLAERDILSMMSLSCFFNAF